AYDEGCCITPYLLNIIFILGLYVLRIDLPVMLYQPLQQFYRRAALVVQIDSFDLLHRHLAEQRYGSDISYRTNAIVTADVALRQLRNNCHRHQTYIYVPFLEHVG